MYNNTVNKKGFTLIELLVVISILGVLAVLIVSNLQDSRVRARDTRKKQNMAQMKTALRLYYNDYQTYPEGGFCVGANIPKACGSNGDECCPGACDSEFAAGGVDGCQTTYMSKLPETLGSNMFYYKADSGDSFCLKVTLENASDPNIATSQETCASSCSSLSGSEYAICAE